MTSPKWIWIGVDEQRTSEEHKSVEMIFHAWHNLMQSVSVNFKRDTRLAEKARNGELGLLKPRYRSVNLIQQIFDKMRSALQKEWIEERERMKVLP